MNYRASCKQDPLPASTITACNSCHAKLHCNIDAYNKKKIPPWNKGLKNAQVAWNKGTKGVCKSNKTSFKKGHKMSDETKKKLSIAIKKYRAKQKQKRIENQLVIAH